MQSPLHETAGKIMHFMEAFSGSKAALNTEKILIVRGVSRQRISIDDIPSKVDSLLKELDAEEIEIDSEQGVLVIDLLDEHIRSSVAIETETYENGILAMKEDFEGMGVSVTLKLCILPKVVVFIAAWKDRANVGPLYVEAVVGEKTTGAVESEPVKPLQ